MELIAKVFHRGQECSKTRKQKALYAGSPGTAAVTNAQVLQQRPAFYLSLQIRKPGHVVSFAIPPEELNFFDFQRQDIGTNRTLS